MTFPLINTLTAGAYKLASAALRTWYAVMRKELYGAQTALWVGDEVLLIKNTYRQSYGLPGGYLNAGEEPKTTAQRELNEDVGIWQGQDRLQLAFLNQYTAGRLQGKDWIYETRLSRQPALTLDLKEVQCADFYDTESAMALPLEPHVASYLRAAARARPRLAQRVN